MGKGEQILKPSGHLVHGQGHHIEPNFEVIVLSGSHDSNNGCGIRMLGEQGLCMKFGYRGVQAASFFHDV